MEGVGLVIQQVQQIAEQFLGGAGVKTLAASLADGIGAVTLRGAGYRILELMIALSVRVLHAVHGQQGLVIAGTQGNHPERVFEGGGLFVQQLVFHRHDVDARMKFLQDFRSEMGGEYDFHPHQLLLHLFPHTLPETGRQGFRQGLLVNLIEGDRLRNPQEMLVV